MPARRAAQFEPAGERTPAQPWRDRRPSAARVPHGTSHRPPFRCTPPHVANVRRPSRSARSRNTDGHGSLGPARRTRPPCCYLQVEVTGGTASTHRGAAIGVPSFIAQTLTRTSLPARRPTGARSATRSSPPGEARSPDGIGNGPDTRRRATRDGRESESPLGSSEALPAQGRRRVSTTPPRGLLPDRRTQSRSGGGSSGGTSTSLRNIRSGTLSPTPEMAPQGDASRSRSTRANRRLPWGNRPRAAGGAVAPPAFST